MGYDSLNEFERALARYGDKVDLIVGLEVGGKLSAEEAYLQIKQQYKELKRIRKQYNKEHETSSNTDN